MPENLAAFPARLSPRKSGEKKFLRFCPRNLLKTLDSGERIQGNPRKSNKPWRHFRSEKATRQENPNGPVGPNVAGPPVGTVAKPHPIQAKAPNPALSC
jgi:hypothetical protein